MEKSVEQILAEVVRYLPLGDAWRAGRISEGGVRAGSTTGPTTHTIITQQPKVDGAIKQPSVGDLFQWPGTERIYHATSASSGSLTSVGASSFTRTGSRVRCVLDTPIAQLTADGIEIVISGATNSEYDHTGVAVIGVAGGSSSIFDYELEDPADTPPDEVGSPANVIHLHPVAVVDLVADEVGADYNPYIGLPMLALSDSRVTAAVWIIPPIDGEDPTEGILRLLLRGTSWEVKRANDLLNMWRDEALPDQTVALVDEWERALGIPDGCFPGDGTVDERRTHILTKLAGLGVQTSEEFVTLSAVLNFPVAVFPGNMDPADPDFHGLTVPADFATIQIARHSLVVSFPSSVGGPDEGFKAVVPGWEFKNSNADFPEDGIRFSEPATNIITCLFGKLKPANCQLVSVFES